MEKTAFLPAVAAGLGAFGLLFGGSAVAGALGFGKPKGMPQNRWLLPSRDIPRLGKHFGELGLTAAFPVSSAALSPIMGLPGQTGPSYAPMAYRPPSISGLTQQQLFGAAPAGAF